MIIAEANRSRDTVSFWTNTARKEVSRVYCEWFTFYVDTGNPVPTAEQFPWLLIGHGLGRVLPPGPIGKRLYDAANSLRAAIERGKSTSEDVAFAATAGVCSLP